MAEVIRLVERRAKDTVQVLEWLLARAKRGEVAGVALCFQDSEGAENAAFTGIYKARPGEAVGAAMQLSWKLTQARDSLTGPP